MVLILVPWYLYLRHGIIIGANVIILVPW
jgi:hypothetical protein